MGTWYESHSYTKWHEIQRPFFHLYYPNTPEKLHEARRHRYFLNKYTVAGLADAVFRVMDALMDPTWDGTYTNEANPLPGGTRVQRFPPEFQAVWGPYHWKGAAPVTVRHHFWWMWAQIRNYGYPAVTPKSTPEEVAYWGSHWPWQELTRHRGAVWFARRNILDPREITRLANQIRTKRIYFNRTQTTWSTYTGTKLPPPREPQTPPARPIENPFHMPRITDDDFEKKKEEYVKEHGYKVRFPGWDDVFHLEFPPTISDDEYLEWKNARRHGQTPDIDPRKTKYLDKKKERYERMLASPLPKWHRNIAAIMTALDDAEDALSTAAVLGSIAVRVAPKLFGALAGPVGWIAFAADLITLLQTPARLPMPAKRTKRRIREMLHDNPFTKQGRLQIKDQVLRRRLGLPALLEAAQVSDQMFSLGISLGPLISFPAELWAGAIRAISGQEVHFDLGPIKFSRNEINHARQITSSAVALATNPILSNADRAMIHVARYISLQVVQAAWDNNDPTEVLPKLTDLTIDAPRPTKLSTTDMLKDFGVNIDETATWPTFNEKSLPLKILFNRMPEHISDAEIKFMVEMKHNPAGYLINTIRDRQNIIFQDAALNHFKPHEGPLPEAWYIDQILNNYNYVSTDTPTQATKKWMDKLATMAYQSHTFEKMDRVAWEARQAGVTLTTATPQDISQDLKTAWEQLQAFYNDYKTRPDAFPKI